MYFFFLWVRDLGGKFGSAIGYSGGFGYTYTMGQCAE
jgi:hypothetical protein